MAYQIHVHQGHHYLVYQTIIQVHIHHNNNNCCLLLLFIIYLYHLSNQRPLDFWDFWGLTQYILIK